MASKTPKAAKGRAAGGQSRFLTTAQEFCNADLKCTYRYSLAEVPSQSAVRVFTATFSKPTPVAPAPPAVVYVTLEVKYEGGVCKVLRYKVEGNKHWFDEKTKFNESWLDKVVERKLAIRDMIPLGDAFT